MKFLKKLLQFFLNLFNGSNEASTVNIKSKKKFGKRSSTPVIRSNAEKIFDFLSSKGYTKYVHPRGIYANPKIKKDPEPSAYRLFIMNNQKLRHELKEKGIKPEFSEELNRYGGRKIINA